MDDAIPPPLPVRRRPRAWIWITAIAVLCVALVGGIVWWGLDLFTDQVADDLRENPVILEHIGEIQAISVDVPATGRALGPDDFVFDLRGSKGSGTLHATVVTIDGDTERVTRGTLELPSGRKVDLFP